MANWLKFIKDRISKTGGTEIATSKSIVDAIGHDGTTALDSGLDAKITIMDTAVDGIQTDLDNATDGLGALKALVDANQVDLDAIIVDTTSIETKVDTVDTVADGIQTDLSNATDGLGALKALIDANQVDLDAIIVDTTSIETKVDTVDTVVDGIQTDLDNGTDGLGAIKAAVDGISSDYTKTSKTITLGTGAVPVTENLFTVTGEVRGYVVGYVDTAVTSAGSLLLEVGITGETAGFIDQTAVAALTLNKAWVDATPGVLVSIPTEMVVANGADVAHIISGADATGGAVTYYFYWKAISADGAVAAA